MTMIRGLLLLGLFALAVAGGACTGVRLPWEPDSAPLTASGTLEADEVVLASRVTARVTALPLGAGSRITAGTTVVKLDDRNVRLQIEQAPDPATRMTYELQAQDYTLTSPVAGIITRVATHVGETAFPGQPLVAVSDLSTLKLTLYVRQADLAQVRVGQPLSIAADPYPSRRFPGVVTSINEQAEFTPRNVQTRTDRLNLVFGVQATVDNLDGALKPGMPVDATFEADTAEMR